MTEYFRPSKIWVGKLCYFEADESLLLPCRITSIVQDRKCPIHVLIIGSDIEQMTDITGLFDRIDTGIFYDIPGGKP